ncbi:MAG: amidohydrolase family protein [Holophagaceae bacterium]
MRLFLLTLVSLTLSAQELAIRVDKLYPVSGAMISDGIIVIQKGKITAVGKASEIKVPEGMTVLRHPVAVPGLIDGHSTVGFSGLLNQPHDQDQVERSAPMQPELRAIDAYNPKDPLVRFLSNRGITTVHTGHGPGALISGQTLIAKTFGNTIDETVIVPEAMIAATLGDSIRNTEGKAPGTRSKAMAMLRSELLAAQAFMKKMSAATAGQAPERNLRMEAFIQVLKRERPLLITAQKSIDIIGALRVAKEFNVQVILDGAADAHLLIPEIKAAGVSVIIHPLMTYPRGEMENMNLETPTLLQKAGIPFVFQSGYEAYVPKTRVVLWEAGMAAGNGLSFDQTLYAVTLGTARLLGIQGRVGSLEVGKDGDVALFTGDPFEWTTRCTGTVINGRLVSDGETAKD